MLFNDGGGCGVSSWRLEFVLTREGLFWLAPALPDCSFLVPPLSKGEDATAVWTEIETHPALYCVQQELLGCTDPAAQ